MGRGWGSRRASEAEAGSPLDQAGGLAGGVGR